MCRVDSALGKKAGRALPCERLIAKSGKTELLRVRWEQRHRERREEEEFESRGNHSAPTSLVERRRFSNPFDTRPPPHMTEKG